MRYWRVMRCSAGHLFETPFLPFGSLKAIRMPTGRVQRCPVCHRMRRVELMFTDALSPSERAEARRNRTSPLF